MSLHNPFIHLETPKCGETLKSLVLSKMKMFLLVLLFSGLVVHNKGLREQDDAVDSDLDLEGGKRTGIRFAYNAYAPLIQQVRVLLKRFQGPAVQRARRLYFSMIKDWDKQTKKERRNRGKAMKAVADNIGAISNAAHDSTSAIIAVLNLLNTLKQLNSSNGHIVSLPAMFTSSFMNLFGESIFPYRFPIKSIIYQEVKIVMEKYSARDIQNNDIRTTGMTYSHFKKLLNNMGNDTDKIKLVGTNDFNYFTSKLYMNGFPVIDKLQTHIILLIKDTRPADAKKFLAYVELYVKLEIVRQMLLTHEVSLIPENAQRISSFILWAIQLLRQFSRHYVRILHNHSLQSKFMAYYDGQVYKVTNAYMTTYLGLPMQDDFPGLSCITMGSSTAWKWKWFKLSGMKHPFFGAGSEPCKWRIVSHGQRLYSIVNKYDCPYGPWCDSMLSFDGGNPAPVTVEHNDPVLWEIRYNPQRRNYDIRTKRFCGNKCNCYLGHGPLTIQSTLKHHVGILECSTTQPKYWKIYQAPSSDMVTDSGSTATNQSSENQEDNSVSGDVAVDLRSDEDNEDNNLNDENENEILENSQPETTEQSNKDSTGNEIGLTFQKFTPTCQ